MYKNLITVASFAAKKIINHHKACFVVPTIKSYHNNYRNRDLERIASCVTTHSQDVTVDQSNLSYGMQQLMDKLEKLAKLDPQLEKILQDYSSDIYLVNLKPSKISNLTAQRLFECNQKVHHCLTRTVGTHELRFLSIVNSDLADECSLMNNQLKKHIFST